MIDALHALALALYLITAGVLATSFAEARPVAPRTGMALLAVGLGSHLAGLVVYATTHGVLPLSGLGPALASQSFVIGIASLVAMITRDARALGLVLTPLLAFVLSAAIAAGLEPAAEPLAFRGAWFAAHVLLATAGYACLAIAFAAGLLYLLQFRALKGKLFGRVFRYFPALEPLDRIGWLAALVGLPALTVGLGLGWAWTLRYRQSLATGDPQVIWGVVTWVVFAVVLLARTGPSRERRGALASVVGFGVVVISYLALRLFLTAGRGFL
jgi:ABC-type transport system involved in cytochrome c biogenesis permease subunit